jgi:Toastrack DUF4097
MRFRILWVLLLVSSVAFGAEWKKDYKVGKSPALQVEGSDASVQVHGTNGSVISATVRTRGWEIGSSNGVRIVERQTGDQVYLQIKLPNQQWNFGNRSVEIEVSVPQDTRVQLTTSDGSVSLENTKASAVLATSDGSIHVADFAGDLRARTSDGSIDVDGRFTALDLVTSDGHIEVDAQGGSKISGSWSARTSDGSIELRLPSDLAFDLDATTSDGSISSDLPVSVEGSHAENRLHGKVNGGGPALQLHTGDGSIHIARTKAI